MGQRRPKINFQYYMIAGYLRVSTGKQHLANQKEEIIRYAAAKQITVDYWVTEIVSGKKNEKERKLGILLRRLKPGDTLIVTEISRLSRTLTDIMEIMAKCLRKKIRLFTTKEGYAFDDSINSKVLCFAFGLVAEIERNLISMRTKEALAMRKANGVILGRRKGSCTKLNILMANSQTVLTMLEEQRTILDICRHFGISRETFNKYRRLTPAVAELTSRNAALASAARRTPPNSPPSTPAKLIPRPAGTFPASESID